MRSVVECPSLIIPNGQGVSNSLSAFLVYGDAECLMLYGPGALDAGVFTIEVSADDVNWATLQENGADVTAPGISKAMMIHNPGFEFIRIKAPLNVAAQREWKISKATYTC